MTNDEHGLILSIRLIRSFEHRNIRHIVVKNIEPNGQMTGKELKELIRKQLAKENIPPPFKNFAFDTLKIEHFPHQAKTNELAIRLDGDERLIIEDEKHLSDYGVVNETEICFFKSTDYEIYKKNPMLKLD